jgi:hypothetical protein
MASAAAMSIYVSFTGHALVLIIISSLCISYTYLSLLSPEVDPPQAQVLNFVLFQ